MMLMPRRDFDVFDDLFQDDFFKGKEKANLMKTDIRETEDSFLLDVDLPGYNKEDIKIDVTDGYLTIHAKTTKENKDGEKHHYVRRERFVGEASRSFYVGDDIKEDLIKASFRNGILSLEIPKKKEEEKQEEKHYIEIGD